MISGRIILEENGYCFFLCGLISSFRFMVSKFKMLSTTASSSRTIDDLDGDTAV